MRWLMLIKVQYIVIFLMIWCGISSYWAWSAGHDAGVRDCAAECVK